MPPLWVRDCVAPGFSDDDWKAWGKCECVRRAIDLGFDGGNWFFGPLDAGPQPVRCRLLKWARCGLWHGSWFRGPRLETAPVVSRDEYVPVLCLAKEASHGLDLSFLTHIFLLEPIRDSALLEQVISRAHRVGATEPVLVNTLMPFEESDDDDHADAAPDAPDAPDAAHRPPPRSPRKKNFICDHCYKSFDVEAEADDHMLTCSRNPASTAFQTSKRFTLNSCYNEIKPPPPF